jgi:hypothetical protein
MTTAKIYLGTIRDGNDYVDQHGDRWVYFADDACGCTAVNHENGELAAVVVERNGSIDLYSRDDGDTFDCGNPAEFIVVDGQWERNED